jgi:hypothetical protein
MFNSFKNDIKNYLRQWQYRFQARQWLRANNDVTLVANLMLKLNRYARVTRHQRKRYIYQLKNCLVHWLYKNGYCTMARQQNQTLECDACDGTGIYWTGDYCYHCGATGIYRETLLYQFFFDVAGKKYKWHQPANLVWWPVELEDEMPGEWTAPHNHGEFLEPSLIQLYTMTVYEFLRKHQAIEYRERFWNGQGEPKFRSMKLEPSLVLGHIVRSHWSILRECIRFEWREWKWRNLRINDDEIPF